MPLPCCWGKAQTARDAGTASPVFAYCPFDSTREPDEREIGDGAWYAPYIYIGTLLKTVHGTARNVEEFYGCEIASRSLL